MKPHFIWYGGYNAIIKVPQQHVIVHYYCQKLHLAKVTACSTMAAIKNLISTSDTPHISKREFNSISSNPTNQILIP